nr:hypothetical protein [Tanacetum cinerariifolium]
FCHLKFTTKIEVSVIMTNGESVKDMTSKFDKLVKFEGQDSLAKEDALSSYYPESCVGSEYTQSRMVRE